jgi:2-oxoglutarate ferredoxin oxidoreductase subunit beta
MLASGAGFIARGYTRKMDLLKELIRAGIAHKGFAFIDVLQICATFFPAANYYDSHVYELPATESPDFEAACALAREWDYNSDARIALGTFFTRVFPSFDERMIPVSVGEEEREHAVRELLDARM